MVAMRTCLLLSLAILLIHLAGSRGDSVQEDAGAKDVENVAGAFLHDINEFNEVNQRVAREAEKGDKKRKKGKNKRKKNRKTSVKTKKGKAKKTTNKKRKAKNTSQKKKKAKKTNNKRKKARKTDSKKKKAKKTNNKRKKARRTDSKKKKAKKTKNTKRKKTKSKKKRKGGKAKGNNEKKKKQKGRKVEKGKTSKKRKTKKDKKTKLTNQLKRNQSLKGKQKKKNNNNQGSKISRQADGAITSWSSCSTQTLNDTCLQNALDSLKFESTQIQNFFKQRSRLKGHSKISSGKLGKKDNFASVAGYMLEALGGNISDPQCGEAASNTSRNAKAAKTAVNNYETLLNCSATIDEACTMPNETYDDTKKEFFDKCATIFGTSRNISDDCRTKEANKNNATSACLCWANAARGIQLAKKEKCTASQTAKDVKSQKNKCIKAFSACKKAEDAAVALIGACVSGDIKNSTQAAKDLHTGSRWLM